MIETATVMKGGGGWTLMTVLIEGSSLLGER